MRPRSTPVCCRRSRLGAKPSCPPARGPDPSPPLDSTGPKRLPRRPIRRGTGNRSTPRPRYARSDACRRWLPCTYDMASPGGPDGERTWRGGPVMAERNGGDRERRARRAGTLTVIALALAVLALLGVLLAGPSHRLGLLGARWALGLFGLAGLLGVAAAVVAAWGVGLAFMAGAWRGVVGSALAFVVALTAAAPLLAMVRAAASVPLIHDITT